MSFQKLTIVVISLNLILACGKKNEDPAELVDPTAPSGSMTEAFVRAIMQSPDGALSPFVGSGGVARMQKRAMMRLAASPLNECKAYYTKYNDHDRDNVPDSQSVNLVCTGDDTLSVGYILKDENDYVAFPGAGYRYDFTPGVASIRNTDSTKVDFSSDTGFLSVNFADGTATISASATLHASIGNTSAKLGFNGKATVPQSFVTSQIIGTGAVSLDGTLTYEGSHVGQIPDISFSVKTIGKFQTGICNGNSGMIESGDLSLTDGAGNILKVTVDHCAISGKFNDTAL